MLKHNILKNSLPSETLNVITRKEQIYRAFNSQELLDHVISSYHLAGEGNEQDQYNVFFTQKKPAELAPASTQIRTLEQDNEMRRKPGGNSTPVDRSDKGKQDMESSRNHRGNKRNYRNVGSRGYTNSRQNWRRDEQPPVRGSFQGDTRRVYQTNTRYNSLADVPRGTCVKCLSNQHETTACNVYQNAAISRGICTVNGQPHGFHHRDSCVVKRNSDNSRGRGPRASFQQNKDKFSRVFRPFRLQK